MQVEIVILVELAAERAVEQLDLGIAERGELRRDRDLRGRGCGFRPRGDRACSKRGARRNRSISKELAPRSLFHGLVSLKLRCRGSPEARSVVMQVRAG